MVNARRGDASKGASPSLGRRHKLQFSVCIVSFVMFTISLEGNCGVIGRAVWLAVYRQPQMVNAGRGDAPIGASPSLGSWHKLQFSVCILFFLMFTISVEEDWGVIGLVALADVANCGSTCLLPFSFGWMLVCKETGCCNRRCYASNSHALMHRIASLNTPCTFFPCRHLC